MTDIAVASIDRLFTAEVDEDGRFALEDLPSRATLNLSVRTMRGIVFQDPNQHVLKPGETKNRSLRPRERAT